MLSCDLQKRNSASCAPLFNGGMGPGGLFGFMSSRQCELYVIWRNLEREDITGSANERQDNTNQI